MLIVTPLKTAQRARCSYLNQLSGTALAILHDPNCGPQMPISYDARPVFLTILPVEVLLCDLYRFISSPTRRERLVARYLLAPLSDWWASSEQGFWICDFRLWMRRPSI